MLALDLTVGLADELRAYVDAGHPMIRDLQRVQVLTRRSAARRWAHNAGGTFDCRWVELAPVDSSVCVWTAASSTPSIAPSPMVRRYVHPDPASLAANGQVALRYCGRNPNGSVDDIAGVCDTTGAVMGLMPHPENHIVSRQHPLHRRTPTDAAPGGVAACPNHLGLQIFQNGVRYAEEH
jgi:phosphoribosylformylglycinamidine synthase